MSVLSGTEHPTIKSYNMSDVLQATYNLPNLWEGAKINVKPYELEFEQTDIDLTTKRKGVSFESIILHWSRKLPSELTDFQTIFNIDPLTYYLKLWIHNDDAIGHKVKVMDLKMEPCEGKMFKYDVVMEFKGIELEAELNLNEAT